MDVLSMSSAIEIESTETEYRLTWRAALLVALFAGSLMLLHLGPTRTLTHHEVLFAQPAKEMLATGNWFVPRFSGIPSTYKPPGTHWVLAATMAITGSESEWVLRVPSAIAVVITAIIVAAMTARWFGTLTGVVAGLMQVTLYYVLQLGRLAECDVFLIACTTGAFYAFAAGNIDSPGGRSEARWLPWLFYTCVGLSYLFKGLVGPVFTLAACGLYLVVRREARVLKFLLNPIGIAILLCCSVGWLLMAYQDYPKIVSDQILNHVGRFQGEMEGGKNPFFYLYTIPFILLPWTPFCLIGLVWAARSERFPRALWWWAVCALIPGIVLLSMSEFKSKHYPAPLMPPLTMVAAVAMIQYFRWRQHTPLRWHVVAAIACIVGNVAGVVAVLILQPDSYGLIAVLVGLIGLTQVSMIYFEYRGQLRTELVTLFTAAWFVCLGALTLVSLDHDSYRDPTMLARRANEVIPANEPAYIVGLSENQITFYLDSRVDRVDQPEQFVRTQPGDGPWYVIAPEDTGAVLAGQGRVEIVDQCASIRRGEQPGDRITLFRVDRNRTADAGDTRTTH